MRNPCHQPQSLASAIGTHRTLGVHLAGIRELDTAWREAVGPGLAAVAFPLRREGEVLVVGVCDTIWIQELSLLAPQILERLAARVPATTNCRRLRCEYVAPSQRPNKPTPTPPRAKTPPTIPHEAIARVGNRELRQALARLAALNTKQNA